MNPYVHTSYTSWGSGLYPSGSLTPNRFTSPGYGALDVREPFVLPYEPPLTFVLVHGAWTGADFWNGIAAELRRRGHTVYIPDYTKHNRTDPRHMTHADLVRPVVELIRSRELREAILAGHSFGGTIVQKTAEAVPGHLKRLVFMNAFVLLDGESAADAVPAPAREMFLQLGASSPDRTIALPFPYYRDAFANLADLQLARRLHETAPAEPVGPLFEKLDLKAFYRLNLPKSYLFLTEDNVLPQTEAAGWHPHMSGRLGLFRLIRSSGDHMSTARTEPAMLARRLYEAARD